MSQAATFADGSVQTYGGATTYLVPMSPPATRFDLAGAPSRKAQDRTDARMDDRASDNARALRTVNLGAALRQGRQLGRGEVSPIIAETEARLERRIRAHLERGQVVVTLTDNRYTMISVRRLTSKQRYELRLHHMFGDADPVIMRDASGSLSTA